NVLRFTVVEGIPTKIASIHVVPSGGDDKDFVKLWDQLSADLNIKIGMNKGDPLDRALLVRARRNIETALAAEGYIGGRAFEPVVSAPTEGQENARWVNVEIPVDIGDKVSFGFRGNKRLLRPELNELVE